MSSLINFNVSPFLNETTIVFLLSLMATLLTSLSRSLNIERLSTGAFIFLNWAGILGVLQMAGHFDFDIVTKSKNNLICGAGNNL